MKKIILQIIVVFILLEVLLRIVFYQQMGQSKLAIIEAVRKINAGNKNHDDKLLQNYNRVRPDSQSVNPEILREFMESNAFEYVPWTEYKNINYNGKYINTNGFIRKTVQKEFTSPLKIFLFGGSTLFGLNLTDSETIASALARIYATSTSDIPPVHITNYGIPAYYSYNELVLLSQLLFSGERPDLVIFLDGVNEFLLPQASQKRIPWFYFWLKRGEFGNNRNGIDSTNFLFELKKNEPVETAAQTITRNYLENIANIKKLCSTYDVRTLFLIQPTPYFRYPNQVNDPICAKDTNNLIGRGYPLLEKLSDSTSDLKFLGNMLTAEKGMPFIDRYHYSPYMSEKIATAIAEISTPILHQIYQAKKLP